MRSLFFLIGILGCISLMSQTRVEESFPVRAGEKVEMNFKHPELITIKNWDQKEIKIVAEVSINYGSNDDAFEITASNNEALTINSRVRDYSSLPRNIVIRYKGEDYFFETDDHNAPEIQKFRAEIEGDGYEYMRHGVIMDIELEVYVPKGISLEVDAKFGMVEVLGFTDELDVTSKFGGIDVSVDTQKGNSMKIRTKFGDVYSNLDMEFSSYDRYEIGRWVTLEGKGRTSSFQYFRSEFGNVYLRKM